MKFLFYKLISNSSFKTYRFYTCPKSTWMPAAPEPNQILLLIKYVSVSCERENNEVWYELVQRRNENYNSKVPS